MKLISPEVSENDAPFNIELIVPGEMANDQEILKKTEINPERDVVNGIIHNDIFEKLNLKTTNINVDISEDGKTITSKLTDRGEFVFSVVEKNRNYSELKNISFTIFYLNRSAKLNFTKQMGGVQPVNYGSVFIYKNGFRINPYGEPGQDFLKIDQRKAQGWRRYLGTREIMGRISIKGDNDEFIETTSRADGFVRTSAVIMLESFFLEKVLKVLEKYVVNLINWGEPLKNNPGHVIKPEEISSQILTQFISNVQLNDVVDVNYNLDIFKKNGLQNNQNEFTASLKKIEDIAEQTKNESLSNLAQSIKKKAEAIISQNIHLEKENKEAEKKIEQAKEDEQVRARQIYFLKGTANQSVTNLLNGFHSIYTLTDATKGNIKYLKELLASANTIANKDFIISIIVQIQEANEKAHKLAELAIHGNQTLSQKGSNNICGFISQYSEAGLALQGLRYELYPENQQFNCRFDTASVGVILDNISSNAIKAGATVLKISFTEESKYIQIVFEDNGIGLSQDIDPQAIFEWGFSSNREKHGFGIGLYHVKQLIEEMKGKIEVDTSYKDGFKLSVRLKK